MKKHDRQWRVNLREDLLDEFVADVDARGMSQKEAVTRLMRCYLAMPVDVRTLMMGVLTPELTGKVARMLLRELGKK